MNLLMLVKAEPTRRKSDGWWFGRSALGLRFAPVIARRDAYPTLALRAQDRRTPIPLWRFAPGDRQDAHPTGGWRGDACHLRVGVEGFSGCRMEVLFCPSWRFAEVGLGEGDGDGDGGDRLASRFCAGWREVVGDVHEDGGGFFAALFFADGAACFVDEVAAFFGAFWGSSWRWIWF